VDSNKALGSHSTVAGGRGNQATGTAAIVAGGRNNFAGANFTTIAGGFSNDCSEQYATIAGGSGNTAFGAAASIGGGAQNSAEAASANIAGGSSNTASGTFSTVGGGTLNQATTNGSTVAGGKDNTASGTYAFVGGGQVNEASGNNAMIPGGTDNVAQGISSFAAGTRAKALHNGSFVWADLNASIDLESDTSNEFTVRSIRGARFFTNTTLTSGVVLAPGGGAWAPVSDSTVKTNIRPVNGAELLRKLDELAISRWSYETQDPSIEHIGPMAQDFHRLFGVGDNDKTITTIDPDGIALAAIKELSKRVDELSSENRDLKARLEAIQAHLDDSQ
jgi:hypothetical protein